MKRILKVSVLTIVFSALAFGQTASFQTIRQNTPRIGLLSDTGSFTNGSPYLAAFMLGLRDLGYLQGQNIKLEARNAERDTNALNNFLTELIDLRVDVLVASSTTVATVAKAATKTIPIVFWAVDPITSGIVRSLERPGENLTGITDGPDRQLKYLTLLKETVPRLNRLAVLFNRSYSPVPGLLKETESAAQSLGLKVQRVEVKEVRDLAQAFSAMVEKRADALIVLNHAMFNTNGKLIVELAAKHRLPMIAPYYASIREAGGLLGLSADFQQVWRGAASFVDRILKGAKPADLPVDQSTKVRIVINLRTAKALGLTIPQSVLRQADEVIQ